MINKGPLILILFVITSEIYRIEAASVFQENSGHFLSSSNTEEEKDLQCGGVFEVVNELSILTHRFNTPLDSKGESCVWTLNVADRSHIKINVTDNNFFLDTRYQYLAVGYFENSNYDQVNSLKWTKFPNIQTPHAIEVPGPVVFVHFSSYLPNSPPEPSFGIRLTFEASGEEQGSIYNYENYFFEGQYGKFKYPPQGWGYQNNQRVTIVVKANSGFPLEGHDSPSKLHVINKGIETSQDCLGDNLNIFMFRDSMWGTHQSFCGPVDDIVHRFLYLNPMNDPIILTFKSDESGAGSGFEIHWLNDDL